MPKQTFFNLPEDKRERILDIALDEFARNDFRSASISRIVAQADIAKGSFYQYFEDKRDLYFYLLEQAAQEKLAYLRQHTPPDPNMDFFAYLQWLFEVGVTFGLTHPKYSQLGYRAVFREDLWNQPELDEFKKTDVKNYYQELIEMGIRTGSIDPQVDPQLAGFMLETVVNELGRFVFRRFDLDAGRLEQGDLTGLDLDSARTIFSDLISILKHGLAPKTDPAYG